MELIKTKYRVRCEMGVCKNPAVYTIALSRAGIKSRIHICDECRRTLSEVTADAAAQLADTQVPKAEKANDESLSSSDGAEKPVAARKRKKTEKGNGDE